MHGEAGSAGQFSGVLVAARNSTPSAQNGAVVGVAVAKIPGHFTGWETAISPIIMLVAVGFSRAVGVFFGS
jgi:hypothetical protein